MCYNIHKNYKGLLVEKTSIKKNFILNAILSLSSIIFPVISTPYIDRTIGPNGTGSVRFVTSAVSYFALFAQLGIPTYGIRACAKVRDNKYKLSKTVHELLIINVISTLLVYFLFGLSFLFIKQFREEKSLFLILSTIMIFNTIGIDYLYKSIEKYKYITLRSIIFKFIALVLMFILVKTSQDYVIYGALTILASSASSIFNFVHSRHYIFFKPLGKYNLRQHIKPTFTFFAMACTISIYVNLDSLMLGFMTTKIDVGYYGEAVKIKTLLVTVVTSLGAVILPRASYYVEHNLLQEFQRITTKSLKFVFVVSIPLTVFFLIFAQDGILLLSGKDFLPAVPSMIIIMPTLLLIGITNLIGIQVFVPIGKELYVVASTTAGAIVDLLLNFILIPKYHAAGAATGTLIAEFVVLIVQLIALFKIRNSYPLIRAFRHISYWKILLSSVIAVFASYWVTLINPDVFGIKTDVKYLFVLFIASACFFIPYGLSLVVLKEPMIVEMITTVKNKVLSSKTEQHK